MQFVTNETGQNKVMTGTTTHPLVNIFIDAAVVSGFIWFLQCVENMATTLTAGDTYTQPRLLLDLEHVTSIGLKDVHLILCEWSQQLLGIEPRFPGRSCHPGVNIEGCENWWLSGGHSLRALKMTTTLTPFVHTTRNSTTVQDWDKHNWRSQT